MADIDVNYDPITVNSGPIAIGINGLDDIRIRYPDPIQTDADVDAELRLRIPDPIRTDGKLRFDSASELTSRSDVNASVDLQPVVLDQCLRLSLAPLPPTRICLPSRQRVSLSLFGVEVVGVTLEGEARVDVTDLPRTSLLKLAKPQQARKESLRVRLDG
ncbi:hypothetical protein [Aurantiacibacter poecillastricola]|uniref:hypothetical protein n=1 Tax=Aurantiacibacter poecillastricola TaxID=3064385 RepID=UPI00273E14F7|nr:hypothetical protein [Aurantiacibacter sp. 219JJ12-13]MDP5261557.1 hypothetical protein [Aurantiacibacter sp. 219JJ12-13]